MASVSTPGQRLLVNMIDYYAGQASAKVYACVPKDNRCLSQGFIDVSYKQLGNAINGAAWWLKDNTVGDKEAFETVAYAGPNDLRYFILVMAAVKCGKRILLSSSFTSAEGQKHLLNVTRCATYLHAASHAPSFQTDPTIRIQVVPELHEWLRGGDFQGFPYFKTWEEARSDPCIILHTSGTTGVPKLIVYTNQMMSQVDAAKLMPHAGEETVLDHFSDTRIHIPMPGSHYTGIMFTILPILLDSIVIMGLPEAPTLSSIIETLEIGKVKLLMLPPSMIEGLRSLPNGLTALSKLDYLYFGGAPLKRTIAEKIAGHTKLFPGMGTTEAGIYWIKIRNEDDWDYYSFCEAMGIEFEHRMARLYELVFLKDPELARWQQVFWVFPDVDRFATGDLFAKHPSRPDLWRYAGRLDDAIVLSSAAKLHPVDVEEQIKEHPSVSAAIIGGEGRARPFLLLELSEHRDNSYEAQEDQVSALWPYIETCHCNWSDTVKLSRDLVVVTSPDKPLVRTVKGSISRKASLELYDGEIEALYGFGDAGQAIVE